MAAASGGGGSACGANRTPCLPRGDGAQTTPAHGGSRWQQHLACAVLPLLLLCPRPQQPSLCFAPAVARCAGHIKHCCCGAATRRAAAAAVHNSMIPTAAACAFMAAWLQIHTGMRKRMLRRQHRCLGLLLLLLMVVVAVVPLAVAGALACVPRKSSGNAALTLSSAQSLITHACAARAPRQSLPHFT